MLLIKFKSLWQLLVLAPPTSLIIERARLTLVIGRAGLESESESEELDEESVVMIGTALRIGGES